MLAKTNADSSSLRAFPFRLFLAFFLPVMCLILGGGWYIGQDRIQEQLELVKVNEINHVVRGVRSLDDGLHDPLLQLRALARDTNIQQGVGQSNPEALKRIAAVFSTLITYNPVYSQVRWVDESGMERVRVNNIDGHTVTVPPDQLQQVSSHYFFAEAMRLKPGEEYVSPLDLNVEHGQVQTPHKPVLRLATPALDAQGQARGFLIMNIAARSLLDAFSESLMEARTHGMLLNSQGYWLRSNSREDEWGFMFGNMTSLAERNPAAWKALGEMESGQVELADGMWTWSTAYPLKVGQGQDASRLPYWFVVSHLSNDDLALTREAAWKPVQAYTLLLLLGFGALAAWLAFAIVSRTRAKVETAQAQAEAEHANHLREAQERFRLVVQANTNGLLVVDRQGQIVLANPALERMFGYGPDEMLGQSLEILLPPAVRQTHGKLLSAYLQDPIARPMGAGRELQGVRKDGSVFPVEISLSPFVEKGEVFVDAFVADISARKRMEHLHQMSEDRLHALVESNPNGLLIISDTGAIELANPAMEQLFGYGHGELYNQPVERLLPKALNLEHGDMLRTPHAHVGGNKTWVRLQGVRKDGGLMTLEVSLAGFKEDGHALTVATVLATDVHVAEDHIAASTEA